MGASVIDGHNFVLCLLLTFGVQLSGWALAVIRRSEFFYDLCGALNFELLFLLSLFLGGRLGQRQVAVTVLACISRAWLGGFLFYRVLQRGGDARFEAVLDKPFQFLIYWVFQALWCFLIASPVIYVNGTDVDGDLVASDIVGIALASLGVFFQVASDIIKFRFRSDPANRGKVCQIGTWAISRHPNYFGEVAIWWGVFICAAAAMYRSGEYWALFTIASPIFTMFLLLFVSGIPLAEGAKLARFMKTGESRRVFTEYFESVPPLVPFVPALYRLFPRWAKWLCCCEFDMYAYKDDGLTERASQDEKDAEYGAMQ